MVGPFCFNPPSCLTIVSTKPGAGGAILDTYMESHHPLAANVALASIIAPEVSMVGANEASHALWVCVPAPHNEALIDQKQEGYGTLGWRTCGAVIKTNTGNE